MATKFTLPTPGDINGQVAAGGNLIRSLGAKDAASLSGAGISLAHASGGGAGAILSGAVTAVGVGVAVETAAAALGTAAAGAGAFAGAMSGLAACGPYGAVAAAVVTFIVTLVSAFQNNYQGVKYVYPDEAAGSGPNAPSVTIAQRIASWPYATPQGNIDSYGDSPGYTLAQYLSVAYPPKTTRRPSLALHLMQQVAMDVLVEGIIGQNQITSGDIAAIAASSNPLVQCGVCKAGAPGMTALPWAAVGSGPALGSPNAQASVSPSVFMSPAGWGNNEGCQAVAAMMLWHWVDWHNINPNNSTGSNGPQTYPYNLYAYDITTGIGKLSSSFLMQKLKNTMHPLSSKLSSSACLARALQRAPDPLFFDADLYGCTPNHSYTLYYNVDLANALVTVCMMLQAGICTQGIVSELLVQANVLAMGNVMNKGPGSVANVSAGFRALLDDYTALAIAENKDPHATMASVISAYPSGFAGRSPSPTPTAPSPLQHWVNLYVAGHS